MPSQCICNVCNEHIAKTKYKIGCTGCPHYFHLDCVGITEAEARSNKDLRYTCVACVRARGGDDVVGVVDHGADVGLVGGDGSLPRCASVAQSLVVDNSDALRRLKDDLLLSMKRQLDINMAQFMQEFEAKTDVFFESLNTQFAELKSSFAEVNKSVSELKLSVYEVRKTATDMERRLSDRICELEKFNSVLQRRLNRANVVIRGLPDNIRDLRAQIINIAKVCGIQLDRRDLMQCCYISDRRAVLVKFNSVQDRDALMRNFAKKGRILLKEVMENCLVESRIYINDHLIKSTSKLIYACRGLLRRKQIKKFRLINGDVPLVEVILPDDVKTRFEERELLALANRGGGNGVQSCDAPNLLESVVYGMQYIIIILLISFFNFSLFYLRLVIGNAFLRF
ncbi:uncharacterized protein [Musca autumnalis]|uniref:uncharacterized protein n=1 Tax=Musca autumnalis TaxID=221902 RepID=UPI003CED36F9